MSPKGQRAQFEKPPRRAPDWAKEAYQLVSSGASIRSAARQLGRPRDAVRYWLQPTRREQSCAAVARWRARRGENPALKRCRCGRVLSSPNKGGVCIECLQRDRERRDRELVRLWRAGRSVREIASALGEGESQVRVRASVLRRRGVDLPRSAANGSPLGYDRNRLVAREPRGGRLRPRDAELRDAGDTGASAAAAHAGGVGSVRHDECEQQDEQRVIPRR